MLSFLKHGISNFDRTLWLILNSYFNSLLNLSYFLSSREINSSNIFFSIFSVAPQDLPESSANTSTPATASLRPAARMEARVGSALVSAAGPHPSPATVSSATVPRSVRSGYQLPVILLHVWTALLVVWPRWIRLSVIVHRVIQVSSFNYYYHLFKHILFYLLDIWIFSISLVFFVNKWITKIRWILDPVEVINQFVAASSS